MHSLCGDARFIVGKRGTLVPQKFGPRTIFIIYSVVHKENRIYLSRVIAVVDTKNRFGVHPHKIIIGVCVYFLCSQMDTGTSQISGRAVPGRRHRRREYPKVRSLGLIKSILQSPMEMENIVQLTETVSLLSN